MIASTAKLKNYRQAARKVRLLADLVRGKSVDRALTLLQHLPKRGSAPLAKLIRSAASNSKTPQGELYISKIEVGGGVTFRRFMPRARGRASAIRKKTSHITLALAAKAKGAEPQAK